MKVIITEKQLTEILQKHQDLKEDEAAAAPAPAPAPSDGSSEVVNTPERPDGVPEMQKWESGVTRGVANPAGTVKKRFADYPEAGPKRGKANPLR